jgi:para-nitrobenzyl esterase
MGKWGVRSEVISEKKRQPRRALILITIVAALTTLTSCAAMKGNGRPDPTTVTTDKGAIQGLDSGSVIKFLGVPYAAAPTGALRFAPPQPRAAWEGVLNAKAPGPACPQASQQDTEDCLYLNLTVPKTDKRNLPVYVWVHGGGFVQGEGASSDGTAIATTANAIVVTMNYRMGILGYIANRALEAKAGDSGNYGLQDQQEALRWVKANIAKFGGDPNNVTLGGESGGAMSTCHHLVSPASAGLFARGIFESGPCAFNWPTMEEKYAVTADIPGKFGCTGTPTEIASCLRSPTLKARDVMAVQETIPRGVLMPGVGGVDVPVQGRNGIGKVPMLVGGNKWETGFYIPDAINPSTRDEYVAILRKVYGDAKGDKVAAAYPFSRYSNGWEAVTTATSDFCPKNPVVGSFAVALCNDVRTYQLAVTDGGAPIYGFIFADPNAPPRGPIHTAELQYLFLTSVPFKPESKALSETMVRYWSNFIKSGNPNSQGLPNWPIYKTSSDVLLLAPNDVRAFDADAAHKCSSFWQTLGDAL